MEKKGIISIVLALSLGLFAFSACDKSGHVHELKNFIVKNPTCMEEGQLEKLCECGYKEYEKIEASGHRFNGGICTVCGESQKKTELSSFTTFEDMYQKVESWMVNPPSKENFFLYLDDTVMSDLRINRAGSLLAKADRTFYNLGDIRVDYPVGTVTAEMNQTVNQIRVYDGRVLVTAGLMEKEVGGIAQIITTVNPIDGILVSKENYLVLHYQDNTTKVVGKIAEDLTVMDDSALIFYDKSFGAPTKYCMVQGAVNQRIQEVSIPYSHLGYAVRGIDNAAFQDYKQLKSVKIAQGAQCIYSDAFENCTALRDVYLPVSVTYIGTNAFYGCSNVTVHYAGTQEQWNQIEFHDSNTQIKQNVIFQSTW